MSLILRKLRSFVTWSCVLFLTERNSAFAAAVVVETLAVPVPNNVPSDASSNINPSFAAFAFEETSFSQYAGTYSSCLLASVAEQGHPGPPKSPNQFSVNLMNAITSRTNTYPVIRVGGTSL